MKKKVFFGVHVGSASILLIFVVLCLISLSVLSIASSSADERLSQKVLDREQKYYEACNLVEQELKDLDQHLYSIYENTSSEQDYMTHANNYPLSFQHPISDSQSLLVTVSANYPSTAKPYLYQITSWKTVTTSQLTYDESLHVITQ